MSAKLTNPDSPSRSQSTSPWQHLAPANQRDCPTQRGGKGANFGPTRSFVVLYTLLPCPHIQTLDAVSSRCERNHINLNISKTKPCLYSTRHLLNTCKVDLKLGNTMQNHCSQYNYLGFILDSTLNMEANFNSIFKRLSYKNVQFSKIRHYPDTKTKVLVYKQTIMPVAELCWLYALSEQETVL